jgi:hypothetical protein
MLLTRSSAAPETGSRASGAFGSGRAALCCGSTGIGSGFSQMLGMASLASSALRRHILSIFASLRGPHLHFVSFVHRIDDAMR